MKSNFKLASLFAGLVMIVCLLATTQVSAQIYPGARRGNQAKVGMNQEKGPMAMIPNLTEEQKTKIKDLMFENGKETRLIHAKVAEKRAHLRLLTLTDNPDKKGIDNTINDISSLQGDLMKNAVNLRFTMKNLLTKEQLQAWESHRQMGKKMKGQNFRQGMQQRERQVKIIRGQQWPGQQNNQQKAPGQAPNKNN